MLQVTKIYSNWFIQWQSPGSGLSSCMTKPTYSNKASRVYLSPSLGSPFLCLHSWLNSPLFVTRRPETPGLMERDRCSFPVCVKSLQSCPTFGDPMDYGPPGSSVCGTFQARTLEWVAIPSSRESVQPTDRTCGLCLISRQSVGGRVGSPKEIRCH